MKILTIIANFILLGLLCLALLNNGISVISFLLLVPVLNIVLMLGSRVNYGWFSKAKIKIPEEQKEVINHPSILLLLKIGAVILNLVFAVSFYVINVTQHPRGSLLLYLMLFVIITPVLSIIAITISSWNKFKNFKRTLLFSGISLGALFICFFLPMRVWIGNGIKENINVAKEHYSGKAEDALIAFLADTTNTPRERTHLAVWTLGQIRSQKALPILKKLYENDPEGSTCKFHHDTVLCQYEIHKAIVSIEHKWLGAKEKNVFGSWARLNK